MRNITLAHATVGEFVDFQGGTRQSALIKPEAAHFCPNEDGMRSAIMRGRRVGTWAARSRHGRTRAIERRVGHRGRRPS